MYKFPLQTVFSNFSSLISKHVRVSMNCPSWFLMSSFMRTLQICSFHKHLVATSNRKIQCRRVLFSNLNLKKEIPILSTMGTRRFLGLTIFFISMQAVMICVFFITNYVVKFVGIIQLFVQTVRHSRFW